MRRSARRSSVSAAGIRRAARRRPRRRASVSSSVSAGTVRVGREHETAVGGLEPVLLDEAPQQRIVLDAVEEAGRADAPGRRRSPRLRRGTGPPARESGSSHARPGGYDGASNLAQRAQRAAPAARDGTRRARAASGYGRGTFSGRRTGSRRRTEITVEPGVERVQPLRRRGEPRADDADRCRRSRAARTSEPRAGRRAAPPAPRAPDDRSRRARARTTPCPSSSKPPATGRSRSIRAGTTRCSSRCRIAQLLDVRRGSPAPSGGSGRRRCARSGTTRAPRARLAHGEPGKRRRQAVAVALGAHVRLPDRRRTRAATPPPDPRIRSPKTTISSGLDPAAEQRQRTRRIPPARRRRRRRAPLTSPSRPAAPGRSSAGTRRTRRAARSAR